MLAYVTLACLFCLLALFALRYYKYILVSSFWLGCLFVFSCILGPISIMLTIVVCCCRYLRNNYSPVSCSFLFFLSCFFSIWSLGVYIDASVVVVVSFFCFPSFFLTFDVVFVCFCILITFLATGCFGHLAFFLDFYCVYISWGV